MKAIPFNMLIKDITSRYKKIKKSDYLDEGKYEIIDQGQGFIAGYTNDAHLVNEKEGTVIAFGDHTTVFKYIDFPFALGADGVKVLKVDSDRANTKFVYYYLKTRKFPEAGYSRHFKFLKNKKVPLPEKIEDQICIATLLSHAEALTTKRKESIRLLDDLLKSTFLEMFGDPVKNNKGWEKKALKKFGNISTGNTPSRKKQIYYQDEFIEWIKTDNIFENKVYATKANEFLSEEGVKVGRTVSGGALLVTCIAGSLKSIGNVALTNRKVAFNQQINAIQPFDDVNPLYLYWLFKLCRKYVQNRATKGMKKIIIKSNFEKILMVKPPHPLQNQFAQIVEKVESLKTKYEASLQELENLYGSLTQRAFSGELDLSKVPVNHELEVHDVVSSTHVTSPTLSVEKTEKFDLNFKTIKELIAQKLPALFTFEMFWEQVNEALLDTKTHEDEEAMEEKGLQHYEAVQKIVYKMLNGSKPFLRQIFNKESKEIVLELAR